VHASQQMVKKNEAADAIDLNTSQYLHTHTHATHIIFGCLLLL
jgi:hypothetical protein